MRYLDFFHMDLLKKKGTWNFMQFLHQYLSNRYSIFLEECNFFPDSPNQKQYLVYLIFGKLRNCRVYNLTVFVLETFSIKWSSSMIENYTCLSRSWSRWLASQVHCHRFFSVTDGFFLPDIYGSGESQHLDLFLPCCMC